MLSSIYTLDAFKSFTMIASSGLSLLLRFILTLLIDGISWYNNGNEKLISDTWCRLVFALIFREVGEATTFGRCELKLVPKVGPNRVIVVSISVRSNVNNPSIIKEANGSHLKLSYNDCNSPSMMKYLGMIRHPFHRLKQLFSHWNRVREVLPVVSKGVGDAILWFITSEHFSISLDNFRIRIIFDYTDIGEIDFPLISLKLMQPLNSKSARSYADLICSIRSSRVRITLFNSVIMKLSSMNISISFNSSQSLDISLFTDSIDIGLIRSHRKYSDIVIPASLLLFAKAFARYLQYYTNIVNSEQSYSDGHSIVPYRATNGMTDAVKCKYILLPIHFSIAVNFVVINLGEMENIARVAMIKFNSIEIRGAVTYKNMISENGNISSWMTLISDKWCATIANWGLNIV